VIEPRTFPIPVGVQTTQRPGSNDVFGKNDSLLLAQTFILGASLTKGSTVFKPPDVEYRLTLAFNANYVDVSERRVLFVEPSKGTSRLDGFVGVQEAFVDYHLRNVSARYDFDSVRAGIQPFSSISAASSSTISNWACGCSATATTTVSSIIWPRSGGWKRTRTAASTTSPNAPARIGCFTLISTGRTSPWLASPARPA
jgi:hypothetical protein